MRKLNKVTASVAGGALVVATAGIAYAYWTTTGTGSGSASTQATAVVMTITGIAPAPITALDGSVPVTATVANPASYSQTAGAVTGEPDYPDDCDGENWTWTPANPVVGNLAASGSKVVTVGTLTLNNRPTVLQDGCKNAVVDFAFSAAPGQ